MQYGEEATLHKRLFKGLIEQKPAAGKRAAHTLNSSREEVCQEEEAKNE